MIKKFPGLFRFLKNIYTSMRRRYYRIVRKVVKVDEKTVLFDSFLGKSFSCNPRYIFEAMLKDPYFEGWTFVWSNNNSDKPISGCINVKYMSLKFFYYAAKSKYWIFNSRMPKVLKKGLDQVYLQTWHGTPLKKLAHDIEIGENAVFYRTQVTYSEMTRYYDVDVRRYNYMISPNRYATKCFNSAFQIGFDRLIETGYPRNDILVNHTPEMAMEIKERLGVPKDKKIILYAPTWRDNIFNLAGYQFEPLADFKRWEKELGEEYFLIYKPHYLITNNISRDEFKNFMYFSEATDNINDLYIISDVLITDYSSVFFDYAVLKRPMLFYMFDLHEYANDLRGFYFDINTLPGPIVEKEDDLLKELKLLSERNLGIDPKEEEKFDNFMEKYCSLEDGKSSERVIDIVFKGKEHSIKMKKVLTYGTFDLLHYGHINILKRAKALGDYLVVAISSDEFNAIKGKKSAMDFETRKEMVESIKYVDEVIREDDWDQKIDDVKDHEISVFVMGDDWEGKFDFLKEHCEVVYLPRTESISTTLLKSVLSTEK